MAELTSLDRPLGAPADGMAVPGRRLRSTVSERVARWGVPMVPAVVAILVVGQGLGRRQLWRDEMATWVASTKSLSGLRDLIGSMDVVLAPYYVLMHGWIAVFGDSEISLRMPSLLAAALAAALTAGGCSSRPRACSPVCS